jgi:DNA polymerase III subunit delta
MVSHRNYLYIGGDALQKEEKVKKACLYFFKDEPVERKSFIAKADPVSLVIEEVMSFSLFAENKIVLFEQCDAIPKKQLDALIAYLSAPRGEALFFMFAESKRGVPKKVLDVLGSKQVQTLAKTSPAQIRQMVKQQCDAQNVQLRNDVMQYFMKTCGDDAESAMREIKKLLLWAGEDKEITLEDCQSLVQGEHDIDVWGVIKAVSAKNTDQAVHELGNLLDHGEDPLSILFLLSQSFHSMYHCKALDHDKVPFSQWATRTGMQGYRLNINRDQSKRFSLDALRNSIRLIRRADGDMKGGKSLPFLVIERLLVDLCRS